MLQQSIDFKALLERFLPVAELPPADRLRVRRALNSGVRAQIEQAGLMALRELEARGALQRLPAEPRGDRLLRYQSRGLDVIAVALPETRTKDGIVTVPRITLFAEAKTALGPVRQLMRLDDPLVYSDPRSGNPRLSLIELLNHTGRDLLGAAAVRFLPRAPEDVFGQIPPLDPELAAQAEADARAILYCPDCSAAARREPEATRRGVSALALAGVFAASGEPLGHLEATSAERDGFGTNELAMLALLADCLAQSWERSMRIDKLVFIDPLTTAFNRSYFDRQVENEIARSIREGNSFALCIVDIDNFKAFNTAHGYEAGNQVLVHVASALKNGVRPFDSVARWGGEEFAVLLTAPVQSDDVIAICERLRTLVERQVVPVVSLDRQTHSVGVTVSMGVALYPDDEKNAQDLFRAANQALLRAKLPPKNKVVFFRPPDRRAGSR